MRSAFLEALTLTTEGAAAGPPPPRAGFWRAVWAWARHAVGRRARVR